MSPPCAISITQGVLLVNGFAVIIRKTFIILQRLRFYFNLYLSASRYIARQNLSVGVNVV